MPCPGVSIAEVTQGFYGLFLPFMALQHWPETKRLRK